MNTLQMESVLICGWLKYLTIWLLQFLLLCYKFIIKGRVWRKTWVPIRDPNKSRTPGPGSLSLSTRYAEFPPGPVSKKPHLSSFPDGYCWGKLAILRKTAVVGQLPPWLCKGRCPWEACLAISALSWGEGRGNRAAGVTLKANEGRAFIPQKRVDGCVRELKRRHVRNGKHNKYFIVRLSALLLLFSQVTPKILISNNSLTLTNHFVAVFYWHL